MAKLSENFPDNILPSIFEILALFKSEKDQLRCAALETLGFLMKFDKTPKELKKKFLKVILARLQDKSKNVRMRACDIVGEIELSAAQ